MINVNNQEKEFNALISEEENPYECKDLPMKNNIIYAFPNYSEYKLR